MHLKENKFKSVNAKIHKMFSERELVYSHRELNVAYTQCKHRGGGYTLNVNINECLSTQTCHACYTERR